MTEQGYNEEAAALAEQAIKRLNVCKLAVEYFHHRDQYDADEMKFAIATEKAWAILTDHQKEVFYMHVVQGFSFTGIGDLKGYSPRNAQYHFQYASKKIQSFLD
jgi:DNA-directed RNA polymerase specialized sigma24 family protein